MKGNLYFDFQIQCPQNLTIRWLNCLEKGNLRKQKAVSKGALKDVDWNEWTDSVVVFML